MAASRHSLTATRWLAARAPIHSLAVLCLVASAGCFAADSADSGGFFGALDDPSLGGGGAAGGAGGITGGPAGVTGGPAGGAGLGGPGAMGEWPGECAERWNPGEKYHPEGYGEADQHGMEAKLQTQACKTCHGDTLEGCGGANSCNNCHDGGHPDGWRSFSIW